MTKFGQNCPNSVTAVNKNCPKEEDRAPFEQFTNLDTLVQALFFLKNQRLDRRGETLIFIDEIQEAPEALKMLRYFHEQAPSASR